MAGGGYRTGRVRIADGLWEALAARQGDSQCTIECITGSGRVHWLDRERGNVGPLPAFNNARAPGAQRDTQRGDP